MNEEDRLEEESERLQKEYEKRRLERLRGGATDEQINQAYKERKILDQQDPRTDEEFLKKRAEEGPDTGEVIKGAGFEIAAGLATDVVTKPLLALPPLYALANFVSGAAANLIAQKLRGETKLSLGEILGSGAVGIIPGTQLKAGKTLSKIVGEADTVKRAALFAGASGVGSEAIRIGIDEQRLLDAREALLGGTIGGVTGAGFQKIINTAPQVLNDLQLFMMRDSMFASGGGYLGAVPKNNPNIGPTELLTQLPKKGAGFDIDEVNNYATRALVYRENRVMSGGKTNLMKGFDETIKNKSGQEFMFVRRSKLKNVNDPAAIENYKLTSVKEIERKLIRSLGFDKSIPADVKALKTIVTELNKLEQQNPKLYLSSLMEYGDKAYLEHKVARSRFEDFWLRVEARNQEDIDNNLFQWTGARGRNTVENLRLLFDPNFKKLKDATETRFINSKLYKSAKGRQSQPDDIVISIEDPGSTTFGANNMFVRSNPGNIQFRKAGTGEVVGSIPDYYRQFYSTAFKEGYKKNYGFLANPNNPAVPPKFRARAGEDVDTYIERVINERIDEAMSGNFDMQNFEANYLEEIAAFYDLFHDKLGWVRLPSWANDIITGKTKFADRLQVEIDDFEIENRPNLPIVSPKTLKQSNLEEALQEIRDLKEDIRKLEKYREPSKPKKGTPKMKGYNPNTLKFDSKTGEYTGTNYGPLASNLRFQRKQLQDRIRDIEQEYGINQRVEAEQQSLDIE